MSHLLKKKRKKVKEQAPRKRYEPFDFMKKFKAESGLVIDVPMSQINTGNKSSQSSTTKIKPQMINTFEKDK